MTSAANPREFFEEMKRKVDPSVTAGKHGSYRFDIDGAGSWHVDIDDGRIDISESDAPADCVIQTSEEHFMRIARGEQNPTTAYMTGKVKVKGDMALALRLREFFF